MTKNTIYCEYLEQHLYPDMHIGYFETAPGAGRFDITPQAINDAAEHPNFENFLIDLKFLMALEDSTKPHYEWSSSRRAVK